jgi:hypothetical protein
MSATTVGPARAWVGAASELARTAGVRGNPLRGRIVHDLALLPGRIGAQVRTARERDAAVAITWTHAADAAWDRAVERLAARSRWFVALLDGAIDGALAEELAELGVVLAPPTAAMVAECDRDGSGWCIHARAVHHAAAAAIARDPALTLELAGRSRDVLLAAVRGRLGIAARASEVAPASGRRADAEVDLALIAVSPALPREPTALLDGLGPPPGVDDAEPLRAAVAAAARFAWALAAGEGEELADLRLLVATLRSNGTMTAAALALALARAEPEVAAELDRLHEEGAVLRTGPAGSHRYRAP